jgi:AbiV family abortive infection protein
VSKPDDRGPKRGEQLFNNVFADRGPAEICQIVAAGISGAWHNAERLLADARLLVESGRLCSARFLVTTAREELAKAPLLVDACMLDFCKQQTRLRKICQAFYDHIAKHAYVELLEETLTDSMEKAAKFWDLAVKRWWPGGDVESGEPDMPHATCFDREFPLYIDFGDYEQRWLVPTDADQCYQFKNLEPIAKVERLLGRWKKAGADGLCSPRILEIINAVFKSRYIKEDTSNAELQRLFAAVEKQVIGETGISSESFTVSPLVRWPLYHFVAQS